MYVFVNVRKLQQIYAQHKKYIYKEILSFVLILCITISVYV